MAPRRHIQIFLSSPGDVADERQLARDLIKDVLPVSPFIRGRATFDVISWDDPHASPGLSAHLTPQEAINRKIPKPSQCDVVVIILWGRMGTPLPANITREDGTNYLSGTEWEYENALNAAQQDGRPEILVYRRTETPHLKIDDPDFEAKRAQYQRVQDFFARFQNTDGSLKGAVYSYAEPDGFRELLRQNLESVVKGLLGDEFSAELGVTKAAVTNMLRILDEREVPPEQLDAKLREIAERHVALTEQLHALSKSNDEPNITERREQAAKAIEAGDYDRAANLLEEAAAFDRRAIDEQRDALDRRQLSAAATLSQQGELERTRLNYRKAAGFFAEAAKLVPVSDGEKRWDYLMAQASTLTDFGREFGDNAALIEAISIYQAVLQEYTRERVPVQRADTQHNLGAALGILGKRESGTARLKEAVTAYRDALEECTRERVPLDWARTQNNLGNTLTNLGERESGTARLEEAVAAFRDALKERTRERVPLDWARTHSGLGNALLRLGERESGTARLEEAVAAFREALKERTRERVPPDWAWTQKDLGTALALLGRRNRAVDTLEEAVAACRSALQERTRDRAPILWADTQDSLGFALAGLGEVVGDTEQLEEAVEAYKLALEVFEESGAAHNIANTSAKLRNTQALLADPEAVTAEDN